MKRIAILGSTGSIGVNALDVVRRFRDQFEIVGLSAGRNVRLIREQALEFRPKVISVAEQKDAADLRSELSPLGIRVEHGEGGLMEVATHRDSEVLLSALVGAQGFLPTLKAISAAKNVALANKETLVVAGPIISREAARMKITLLPVDSEHSAIWQCLQGAKKQDIRKLILTASGGPFLSRDVGSFESITIAQALAHPNWRMGRKITIDSATLMNKGLEMIEAHFLFDEPPEKLEVIIHPQSVIHSMVEFVDGSVLAQLGISDMRMPIQYALAYPERWKNDLPSVNLAQIRNLDFLEPDLTKFPCLRLAQEALRIGGTMTAVLNAANEIAVENFLAERISFPCIHRIVEAAMQEHHSIAEPSMEDVLEADRWARQHAGESVVQMQA